LSVYKDPRSPYWQFDFRWRGHRFFGSTKTTTRRDAEAVERTELQKAKARVAAIKAAKTSLRLDDVAGRYWQEHGQHHAGADDTWYNVQLLIEFFGKENLITDITGDDVARLVAWRRGHRARPTSSKLEGLISPFTVNTTTMQLRKLFTRAKLWGVRFEHEPKWSQHMLSVPSERVREVSEDELERLEAEMRGDYAPFVQFALASGMRLNECLLRWPEVDWRAGQIRKHGKGGRLVVMPITATIREILWPLRGHHPEMVFTYVCEHGAHGRIKGQRYPITYDGAQTFWRRLRKRSGVVALRFHDLRHDFGTKMLRATGNLKLVQKAMNHTDIKSTLRYAHVLDEEVAEAMERVARSRKKSRTTLREVG
jgi:integrase